MSHANRHPISPNDGDQFLMCEGIEVGKQAWNIFPEGDFGGSVGRTAELMADPNVLTIFEAAVLVDGYAAKADVLRRQGGAWELIEVKASVNEHDEFTDDMAYTAMVLQRAVVAISKASLMLLNRHYRLGMTDADLFAKLKDLTTDALLRASELMVEWDGDLAERLLHDLQSEGSIIVYHAAMEKNVICDLPERFPDLRESLKALLLRIVDLERIIIDHFNHPDFKGRTSIKVVLPALVPDMSYEGMEIGDGFAAVAAFAKLARGEFEGDEAERMKRDLLEYCKLDTEAMVRVHERLLAMAEA